MFLVGCHASKPLFVLVPGGGRTHITQVTGELSQTLTPKRQASEETKPHRKVWVYLEGNNWTAVRKGVHSFLETPL